MKHFLLSFFLLLLFHSQKISAQPYVDVLSVRYYSMPQQKKNSEVKWFTAGMDVPLKIKKDYLVLSPTFENYNFAVANNSANDLYGIIFPITLLHQTRFEYWKMAFTFIPRLNSDFKKNSDNDTQLGGALLAVYRKKENLKYKFGVYYNSEFFGLFIIPLFGIDWNINPRVNLFGVLPGSMNLEYKLSDKIYSGVAFRSITNSYGTGENAYIKIQDNHLRLFVDYYLTKHFVLNVEAGHSVLRKYSYGINTGSKKNSVDLKYADGPVLKAGIAWRIRLDDKK